MADTPDASAAQRKLHQEEIDEYLAAKELLLQAQAAYDAAKEAYDKAAQHSEKLHRRAANN